MAELLRHCAAGVSGIVLVMADLRLGRDLRLHLLRAIDEIERQRSLGRASVALRISQPSLTKSLRTAEAILGVALFERHARGMQPTPAGTAVAHTARRILTELRQLEVEIGRFARPGTSTLSLGVLPTAARGVLPGVISRLSRSSPDIKVQIEQGLTEELLPRLAAGEVDMVVGRLYEPAAEDGFVREALWSEPIAILARAGHPLLLEETVGLEQLRRYELLLPSITQRLSQDTEQFLTLLGLDGTTSLRSSSFSFIREMLYETDSLSAMPQLMMVGDLLRGTLTIVPLQITLPPRLAGLIIAPRRELGEPARVFIACLRAYLQEVGVGAEVFLNPGKVNFT